MINHKCFIMGLPEAGKTTFLAALWYCLNYNNKGTLKIKSLSGDNSYISGISIKWANAQELSRTKPDFEKLAITLTLENERKEITIFTFPDLSGESFQSQYEKRETKKELAEYAKNCSGILLFINPEIINEPCLISKINPAFRFHDGEEIRDYSVRNPLKDDPTQVHLVELLQFVAYIRNDKPVILCPIISAWDLVEKTEANLPEEFIQRRMPLLWQYLRANSPIFNSIFFGISAQGGELTESEKLLEKSDPCERIIVVDNEGNRSNDISLPLSRIVSFCHE